MKQYVPYTRLNNSTSAPSLNFVSQLTPRSFTGLAPQPLSSPRPVGNVAQEAYHSKLNLAKGRDNQLSFSGRFEESPLASLNMKKSNSQLIPNISSPPLIMQKHISQQANRYNGNPIQNVARGLPRTELTGKNFAVMDNTFGGQQKFENFGGFEKEKNVAINPEKGLEDPVKKIKDLQSQLKFEEKYSNDLYRQNEGLKKQLKEAEESHSKEVEKMKQDHASEVAVINETVDNLKKELANLRSQIQEKQEVIQSLQENNRQKQEKKEQYRLLFEKISKDKAQLEDSLKSLKMQNEGLSGEIAKFNESYKIKLYEDRISQLSEEKSSLYKINNELSLEKLKLLEDITLKVEKIKSLTEELERANDGNLTKLFATARLNDSMNLVVKDSLEGGESVREKQMQRLKKQIESKAGKINELTVANLTKESELRQSKDEISILTLKSLSEKKSLMYEKEKMLSEKQNEIKTLKNQIKMLEIKFKTALKEVEEKDKFLQKYLMGRTKDEDMKQYIVQVIQHCQETFADELKMSEKLVQMEEKIKQIQTK